jgi:hypothetical protein
MRDQACNLHPCSSVRRSDKEIHTGWGCVRRYKYWCVLVMLPLLFSINLRNTLCHVFVPVCSMKPSIPAGSGMWISGFSPTEATRLRFDQEKSRLHLIRDHHMATKRFYFLVWKQPVFCQLLTRCLLEKIVLYLCARPVEEDICAVVCVYKKFRSVV